MEVYYPKIQSKYSNKMIIVFKMGVDTAIWKGIILFGVFFLDGVDSSLFLFEYWTPLFFGVSIYKQKLLKTVEYV